MSETPAAGKGLPPESPWYSEGLAFECTQCGNCCSGGPGAVWANDEELTAIAEFLGRHPGEFRLFETRIVGSRRTLREHPNGDCVFLDGASRRCQIYPVRPLQCRTWPFWTSNLESPAAWDGQKSRCPGMGRGEFVSLAAIEQSARLSSY